MDTVEAAGKSVDDAIVQALARLGRRRDEVDVQVLQEPSRGVRGVGVREARVRVWVKATRPAPPPRAQNQGAVLTPDLASQWLDGLEEDEEVAPPPPVPPQRVPSAFRSAAPPAPAPITDDEEDDDDYEDDDEEGEDDAGEYDDDAPVAAPLATQPQLPVVAPALADEGTITGTGPVPDAVARQALDIVRTILGYMNLPGTVTISRADPFTLNIQAHGNDEMMGLFIGRHGETLAAVQLIVNMMLNRQGRDHYHIVVDIDHYRARRDDSLRSLARRVAQQVRGSQRPITLEPMTPYERRIVHMTLQDLPDVQTQSTGEGEGRRVMVLPKRPSH